MIFSSELLGKPAGMGTTGATTTVGTTDGYLATPEKGAGPAVLVITEPTAADQGRQVCDELAVEGFTALAPELRNGHTADDLAAAIGLLKPHPAVRGQGIGVVGYAAGADLALWLAAQHSGDVVAVDVNDPALADPAADQPDWSGLNAAVQVHGDDEEDDRLGWIRTLEFLRKHLG
jgi:carboxymethylenebutenolidase